MKTPSFPHQHACGFRKTLLLALFIVPALAVPASWAGEAKAFSFRSTAPVALQEGLEVQLDRLGMVRQMTQLLGKKVRDSKGKNVGKLEDLVLDLESGRVLAAVLANGKNLDLVPALAFDTAYEDRIELNVERKTLESVPRLSTAAAACEAGVFQSACAHFGKSVPATASPRLISQLAGQGVVSSSGESLGKVRDAVMDLTGGKLIYVVIEPQVGPNTQENLYLAPGKAFSWNQAGGLTLKATQQHFLASRVVSRQFPTELVLPEVAKAIYSHYSNDQAPVQVAAAPEPAAKAVPARSDVDISREVLSEIMVRGQDSLLARVNVNTVKGAVTLRGVVKDEAQRQNVLSIAEKVAGTGNVNSELEIRGKVRTAKL